MRVTWFCFLQLVSFLAAVLHGVNVVAGILALRLAGVEQEAVWAEVVQRCSAARPALPVLVALVGVREHVMLVCRVAPMRRGRGGQQQQRDRHPRLLTVAAHCSLSTLISHCATAPVRTTLCCTRNTLLGRAVLQHGLHRTTLS